MTCLFDAIVATARSVQEDAPRARALVLVTDGIDTASLHSGEDAATAAARLDLPVYVIGVGRLAGASPDANPRDTQAFSVAELARRTGGFSGDGTSASPAERADPIHPRRAAPPIRRGILRRLRARLAPAAGPRQAGQGQCEIAGWLSRALSVGSWGS